MNVAERAANGRLGIPGRGGREREETEQLDLKACVPHLLECFLKIFEALGGRLTMQQRLAEILVWILRIQDETAQLDQVARYWAVKQKTC